MYSPLLDMSYRILLVDDEAKSLDALEWKISQVEMLRNAKLMRITKSRKALSLIKKQAFDIIFLDINMPYLNGIELADFINEYQQFASIIFTTGYDRYHLDALRQSAVDYLQKPIDIDELKLAVDRFLAYREKLQYDSPDSSVRIAVHDDDGISYILKTDILYCSSMSNYSFIYLKNGRKLLTSRTLKYQQSSLGSSFFRIHNQYLVNLSCISKYHRGSGGSVELIDGTKIPVARRKKEELLVLLGS